MANLQNLLNEIDRLFQELKGLSPLKKEYEQRLWEKFRLEWNYNSNHIEGNTLSYGETYLLLIKGDVTGDHKVQEIDEMRAHDLVVSKVREYAEDRSRDLTEADIREWNRIILVRPYWKEAITQDGQATQKLIEPGTYKKTPNSVRLPNGELFHYASPEETPILMRELIEWYRDEHKKRVLHPVELAALLHYKFVRIHPFDDSNGRTARLLMNYELLRSGYPPVVIKSNDKKNYLFALSKADAGDIASFVEYVAKEELWSLGLNLKAAKGESVEEVDDVYKEIEVWKKRIHSNENTDSQIKTVATVRKLYNDSIRDLLRQFVEKHSQFTDLFVNVALRLQIIESGIVRKKNRTFGENWLDFFEEYFSQDHRNERALDNYSRSKDEIAIEINLEGLKAELTSGINLQSSLRIAFEPYFYSVTTFKQHIVREYSIELSEPEIDEVVASSVKYSFTQLKLKVDSIKK